MPDMYNDFDHEITHCMYEEIHLDTASAGAERVHTRPSACPALSTPCALAGTLLFMSTFQAAGLLTLNVNLSCHTIWEAAHGLFEAYFSAVTLPQVWHHRNLICKLNLTTSQCKMEGHFFRIMKVQMPQKIGLMMTICGQKGIRSPRITLHSFLVVAGVTANEAVDGARRDVV